MNRFLFPMALSILVSVWPITGRAQINLFSGSFGGHPGLPTLEHNEQEVLALMFTGSDEDAASRASKTIEKNIDVFLQNHAAQGFLVPDSFAYFIQAYGIQANVLNALEPASNADDTMLARFGAACELLGQTERASEYYARVLRNHPEWHWVRRQQLLLSWDKDLPGALALIKGMDPNALRPVGPYFAELIGSQNDFGRRLALFTILAAYLKEIEASHDVPLEWIPNAFAYVADNNSSSNRYRIRELYRRQDYNYSFIDDEQEQRSLAIEESREELHNAVCESLMTLPTGAAEGFRRFIGLAIKAEKPAEELRQRALKILLMEAPLSECFTDPNAFMNYNESYVDFYTPEEYLLVEALNDPERMATLESETIPALKSAGKAEIATFLNSMVAVYKASDETFLEKATTALIKSHQRINKEQLMRLILAMKDQRGLVVDIQPLILSRIESMSETQFNNSNYILEYARGLSDGPAVESFLEAIAERLLGPKDKRESFMKEHYRPNQFSQGTPSSRIYVCEQLFSQLMQDLKLVAPTLRKADALGMINDQSYRLSNGIQNAIYYYRFREQMDAFVTFLKQSDFTGDPTRFRTYPMRNLSRASVFGQLIYQLSRAPTTDKNRFIAAIEGLPDAFGKSVILAALSTKPSPASALAAVFEKHMQEIRTLEEDRQNDMAQWLNEMLSSGQGIDAEIRDVAPIFTQWYTERANKPKEGSPNAPLARGRSIARNSSVDINAFMNATSFNEIGQLGWSATDYAGMAMNKAFNDENAPDKVLAIADHFMKLEEAQWAAIKNASPPPSQLAQVLRRFLSSSPGPGQAGLAMRLIKQYDVKDYLADAMIQQKLSNAICGAPLQDIHQTVETFLDASKGVTDLIFLAAWLSRFSSNPGEPTTSIEPWLASPSDSEPLRVHKEQIAKALQLSRANGDSAQWFQDQLSHQETSQEHKHLLSRAIAPIALRARLLPLAKQTITFLSDHIAEDFNGYAMQVLNDLGGTTLTGEARELAIQLLKAANGPNSLLPWSLARVQAALTIANTLNYPAEEILKALPTSAKAQDGFLALLVESGHSEAAIAALPASFTSMPPMPQSNNGMRRVRTVTNGVISEYYESSGSNGNQSSPYESAARFTKTLEANLPNFLNDIRDPGHRFMAETLLSALSDGESISTPRPARMQSLLNRYNPDMFTKPALGEQGLAWLLALNPDSALPTGAQKAVQRFGATVDPTFLNKWGSQMKSGREIVLRRFIKDAFQNNPPAFTAILERHLEDIDNDSSALQQFLQNYCGEFPQALFENIATLTPEKAYEFLPLFRRLSTISDNIYLDRRDQFTNGNLLCHVLANASKELDQWMEGLSEDEKRTFQNYVNPDQVIFLLRTGLTNGDVPADRRLAILSAVMSNTVLAERSSNGSTNNSLFSRLIDLNMLTKQEILDFGPGWAESNSRNGAAFMELGTYQAEEGQQEEAIESFLRAVVESPRNNPTIYSQSAIAEGKLLLKMGRIQPALEWFKFIQPSKLASSFRSEYEDLHQNTIIQYLKEGNRAAEWLRDNRLRVEQNSSDHEAWKNIAEALTTIAEREAEGSHNEQASALLKTSYYILTHLKRARVPGLDSLTRDTKTQLVKIEGLLGRSSKATYLVEKASTWQYSYGKGPMDSDWRYDYGSLQNGSWQSGRGPLGYGDNDETTVLSFGDDKDHKPITAYFRLSFAVSDIESMDSLSLGTLHDDGVIVYLNGQEIARNNMPAGNVSGETLAPESRSGDEENAYWEISIDASRLQESTNLLAAEVHQNEPDSSDLGFDLYLRSDPVNIGAIADQVKNDAFAKSLGEWHHSLPTNINSAFEAMSR